MTTPSITNPSLAPHLLSEPDLVRAALADDYDILNELGRGGMAIVFRAHEKALDREVAIKVLPSRLMVDEGFVERFENEARTAAKLEHPNIVPIYRVGRAGPNGEVIYFVMKLLRGQSLLAVLKERGKLDPVDVRRILMETAGALGYAARRGVVHRDIKPDNIMLDSEGRCVVTDFGIAKVPGGQTTAAGTSLGTPLYMSPEQATGAPLDGRSDIYSLGVVAYRCLIGKTPFDSDDPFAILYKHIHEPLPDPPLATDEERHLFAVIARMMAKKPDDRFQETNELIAALGGQISAPTLVSSVRTSVGMMAPTELIATPQPWHAQWWTRLSTMKKLAFASIATVAAAGVAIAAFALGAHATVTDAAQSPATLAGSPAVSQLAAKPVTSDSAKAAATASVAPAPRTPPKPVPSPRAAAILAYDKVKSNCPKRDTLASAAPIDYAVLMDAVADRPVTDRLDVSYDVCGLAGGSAFITQFTLTKLRQRGFGQQKPHAETAPATAKTPRARNAWTLDTREMSAGAYRLDIVVTDGAKRRVTTSREFRILDK